MIITNDQVAHVLRRTLSHVAIALVVAGVGYRLGNKS